MNEVGGRDKEAASWSCGVVSDVVDACQLRRLSPQSSFSWSFSIGDAAPWLEETEPKTTLTSCLDNEWFSLK
jgi:hypothetical protein